MIRRFVITAFSLLAVAALYAETQDRDAREQQRMEQYQQ